MSAASTVRGARLAPIDWMRGLVMILMTSDHAAHGYYRDHLVRDGVMLPGWSEPLPVLPFLNRWLSHLCAPTFVFLAGTAIALSITRKRGAVPERSIDRDLMLRGIVLIGLDLTLISGIWAAQLGCHLMLQVLYAIGVGMLAMVGLRRLSPRIVTSLGIGVLVGHEALVGLLVGSGAASPGIVTGLTVTGGFYAPTLAVVYPALPWLAMMLLGYGYGMRVAAGRDPVKPLWLGALGGLGTFALVRGLDGYGNLLLTGVDDSPLRWLQVSKYPPSLSFAGLELGLMALLLGVMFRFGQRGRAPVRENGLLLVLGQTALFFYLAHILLLEGSAALINAVAGPGATAGGLDREWLAVGLTVVVLYPACRWFRRVKRRHPASLLRLC